MLYITYIYILFVLVIILAVALLFSPIKKFIKKPWFIGVVLAVSLALVLFVWTLLKARGIQIEHKEKIIKRLGRSTDRADAVVMAAMRTPVMLEKPRVIRAFNGI